MSTPSTIGIQGKQANTFSLADSVGGQDRQPADQTYGCMHIGTERANVSFWAAGGLCVRACVCVLWGAGGGRLGGRAVCVGGGRLGGRAVWVGGWVRLSSAWATSENPQTLQVRQNRRLRS